MEGAAFIMHMKKNRAHGFTPRAKKSVQNFKYFMSIFVLCILITRFSLAFLNNNISTLLNYDTSTNIVSQTLSSQYVNLDLSTSKMLSFQLPFVSYIASAKDSDATKIVSTNITAEDEDSDDDEKDRELSEKLKTEILSKIDNTDIQKTDLTGTNPKVLIYHTHTEEAYLTDSEAATAGAFADRSYDTSKSVVAVGEELATELKTKYGISVIHDTTDHEPPYLGTAYERSLATINKYKKLYPSLEVFIDIHRDGFTVEQLAKRQNDYVTIDGKQCAKILLVVGNGQGSTGQGFSVMPNYESNYKLAQSITDKLNATKSGLAKSVLVKTGRYNQHVSTKCILLEVGHNGNTITQALNSVPYAAKAIYESISSK